jgi:arylsulfatase A-like enzyme/tetratricopeptide (TPR) repeat protein
MNRTRTLGNAVAAAAVLAAVAGGVWLASRTRTTLVSGSCPRCNVLLITIDTLRRDRVGAFGGPAGLTPTLDRLAAEGFRLTRTYSAAPLTLPSHASILTAVSPPVHGVRANGLFRLGPRLPTLATILKSAGYRTGAFVGAFVLDARFGLNRGFDVYDDRYGEKHPRDPSEGAERRAEDVVKPATAWILHGVAAPGTLAPGTLALGTPAPSTAAPFFAWLHLYDPHEPYRAPEPYASRYAPYDAEVAYTDATIGRFLDDLRAAGRLDRTLVVVAADHGESLGEHGERTHGVFAYDVTLRVPWLLWAGAHGPSGSSDALARLIDLAPTTLDLVGVAAPSEFEGRSLVPAVSGRLAAPAAAYFEAMDANLTRNWAPLAGIVSGGFKLIDLPIPELYDLAADPGETSNLFVRDAERSRMLGGLLRAASADFASRQSPGEKVSLGAEARQRLQALGYVASSADAAPRRYTDVDDPKTMIGPSNELNEAVAAFRSGAHHEAMSAVRGIMQRYPAFTTAAGILASMQHDEGDVRGAVMTLEQVVRGGADQSVFVVLAGYLQEAGELGRAADLLRAVIAAHPDYADAYNSLGVVESRRGRHDLARAAFEQVLRLDATSASAYENLGVDQLNANDLNGALASLTAALTLDPDLAAAHNAAAAVYLKLHRPDEALDQWRTAVQIDPLLYDALYNLGTVLWDRGRHAEARPYIERFVRDAPQARYARDIARLRTLLSR